MGHISVNHLLDKQVPSDLVGDHDQPCRLLQPPPLSQSMSNVAPDDDLPGRREAILLKRTVGIRQGYWAAWGLVFGNQSCLNEPIM